MNSSLDPYAPPLSPLAEAPVAAPAASGFYVVAPRKFWSLFLATSGVYGMYWMYRHWRAIKRATGGDQWPVPRGIFTVFFVHSLTRQIEAALQRAQVEHAWAREAIATVAVVAMLVGNGFDRAALKGVGSPWTDIIGIAMLLPIGLALARIQVAANLACGDAGGTGNARFTAGNWAWLVMGGLFWALVLVGFFVPA